MFLPVVLYRDKAILSEYPRQTNCKEVSNAFARVHSSFQETNNTQKNSKCQSGNKFHA